MRTVLIHPARGRLSGSVSIAMLGVSLLVPGVARSAGVVEFMGSHFVITKSEIVAQQGIAFEPTHELLLSAGQFDRCGTLTDNIDVSSAGLSWDPIEDTLWRVDTATRQVRKFAGSEWVPVFTIPEVLDVPGVGADTLWAPQGLALDEGHVYIVDSGPDLGQIESNAWFKFERDGTPVTSSAVTDFVAGIVAPPDDAVVDGITWCPPTSPVAPGLFLVAVEHTGILVVDADGFVVDDIVWDEAGLVYGESVPFAFAGITIDPVRGDLYLVENSDGGGCHVWVRIPEEESVYLGSIARVHRPTDDCHRQLLVNDPATGLSFGLAYREQDGLVWSINYSSGDLVAMNPISGQVEEVIPNGGWPVNVWGVTHDPAADDLYLLGNDNQLYVVDDLAAPTVVPLPAPAGTDYAASDIAWSTDDGFIYTTTGFGGEYSLVRIDPTTGAGVAIEELDESFGGIVYDPRLEALVAIESGTANQGIFAIDPVSGETFYVGDSPTAGGWEGLAIVNPPADILPVEAPVTAAVTPGLRAAPTPFRTGVRLAFEVHPGARPVITIHDVAGRRVREWTPVSVVGGVRWDGRSASGRPVPPGTYFARITGEEISPETVKVVRIR